MYLTTLVLMLPARAQDTDGDGVPDVEEIGDFDHDGIPDVDDVDDDNDGIPTLHERYLCTEGDRGTALASTVRADLLVRTPGLTTCTDGGPGDSGSLFDWDGDGQPNHRDPDDDGDGVPTLAEDDDVTFDPATAPPGAVDPGPQPETSDAYDTFDMGTFTLVDDGDP
ncbi:MAG: hypothetical protein KC656_12300, partial [Myxococcales bacterium]|nr:hypothetical protein [Myxococcales bacterium]